MKEELSNVHGDIEAFMGESERIVINPEPLEAYAFRESGLARFHTQKKEVTMGTHASIRGQISVENIPAFIRKYIDAAADQKEILPETKVIGKIPVNQT